jgi:hypothetical protein
VALDHLEALLLAILITVWRVMPFRKQSGVGVWITPSCTKNTFEPVLSAM